MNSRLELNDLGSCKLLFCRSLTLAVSNYNLIRTLTFHNLLDSEDDFHSSCCPSVNVTSNSSELHTRPDDHNLRISLEQEQITFFFFFIAETEPGFEQTSSSSFAIGRMGNENTKNTLAFTFHFNGNSQRMSFRQLFPAPFSTDHLWATQKLAITTHFHFSFFRVF